MSENLIYGNSLMRKFWGRERAVTLRWGWKLRNLIWNRIEESFKSLHWFVMTITELNSRRKVYEKLHQKVIKNQIRNSLKVSKVFFVCYFLQVTKLDEEMMKTFFKLNSNYPISGILKYFPTTRIEFRERLKSSPAFEIPSVRKYQVSMRLKRIKTQ